MFDDLPATRGSSGHGVALALATALGLHAVAFVVLPVSRILVVAAIDPPPIPVRFVSSPAALPLASGSEEATVAPPALPPQPRLLVARQGEQRDRPLLASTLQPNAVPPPSGPGGGVAGSPSGSTHERPARRGGELDGSRRGRRGGSLAGVEGGGDDPTFGDAPLQVGGDVHAPEVLEQVKPIYPELALLAHKEGLVIINAIINTLGLVEDVHVLSGDPLLGHAALAAITRWRFRPGELNGKPVKVSFTLTVRFVLEEPDTGFDDATGGEPPVAGSSL